ncbi:MAG TPA: serine/threonine-protein kinase [Vicinamibacterales bacterium]|nr:serine/threonine-protein kinase [Vicinamibacterales bacterium]
MTVALPPGSDDFRRAQDIFSRAREIEPAQREAFIVNACGSNLELLTLVRALLNADGRNDKFLETPTHMMNPLTAGKSYAAPGDLIGKYKIERILGEGGMGVVYLAWDERLERLVAIKVLSPAYTHDPNRRERFQREARAAAALAHSGIPTVFDFEEHEGEFFFVAEYIEGETLRPGIARGAASVASVIETAAAIASVLAAAHDRGIVHRDLKPENVMRTPKGEIKILDFGLARLRDFSSTQDTLTKSGSLLGTLAYMAPEQIRHGSVDGRADLFALGILLHEMATGIHPFLARNPASTIARILETEAPPLGASAAGQSDAAGSAAMRAALDGIIRRCLRKDQADRYSSAHELLAELERARDGRGPSGAVPVGPAGPQRWWRVHHLVTCIAYLGLMVPMGSARLSIDGGGGRLGLVLFLATLGAVVASIVLRLHLWFTASSIPGQWARQYRHATPWLRLSDSIAVLGFLVAGGALIVVNNASDGLAAVLICAGVITGLSFAVIEPATTRAAFDQDG